MRDQPRLNPARPLEVQARPRIAGGISAGTDADPGLAPRRTTSLHWKLCSLRPVTIRNSPHSNHPSGRCESIVLFLLSLPRSHHHSLLTQAKMAGGGANPASARGAHPFAHPHVRPFYRFAATGLGAAMWFFVRIRDRKLPKCLLTRPAAVLPSETRHAGSAWLETSVGALEGMKADERALESKSTR